MSTRAPIQQKLQLTSLEQLSAEPAVRGRRASPRQSKERTVAFALAQIFVIWGIAAWFIFASYKEDADRGEASAQDTSLTIAAYTGQALSSADLVLKSIQDWVSQAGIFTQEQFSETMSRPTFAQALRDRLAGVPHINTAVIAALNGDVVNSNIDLATGPPNISDREAFRTLMAPGAPDVALTTVGHNPQGRWTFYLARRATDQFGNPLGIIIVGIDADYLSGLFRKTFHVTDSVINLFRTDGAMLATTASTAERLGRKFPDAPALVALREGRLGTPEFTMVPRAVDPLNTDPRIVAGQAVAGFPVIVSVAVPQTAYLAGWPTEVCLTLAAATIFTLLTLVIATRFLELLDRSETAGRIAAERRLLAVMLDTPAAMCAVIDRSGNLAYGNTRFGELFAALSLSGGSAGELFDEQRLAGGENVLRFAASNEPGPLEIDLRGDGVDGNTRYLRFTLSRQALPGLGDCTVMVGHDETERLQAQRAVIQSAKLATLGELTTGMAHELTQPLNVMRIAAQNALMELDPTEGGDEAPPSIPQNEQEFLQFRDFLAVKFKRIVAQVDRAADIVQRMRIFGRAPKGPPVDFDARSACRSAIALVDARVKREGVTIRAALGVEPLMLRGHQNLLEMVLVNLLLNAKDALETSGQNNRMIDVVAHMTKAGRVCLTVADNGPGVPAELRDRIFEPFFTAKPTGKGAGLGLATSFGIVRDAGGSLSLLPSEDGAVFQVDLPAAARG